MREIAELRRIARSLRAKAIDDESVEAKVPEAKAHRQSQPHVAPDGVPRTSPRTSDAVMTLNARR